MGVFGFVNNSLAAAVVYRGIRKSAAAGKRKPRNRYQAPTPWQDEVTEWWPPLPPEDDD